MHDSPKKDSNNVTIINTMEKSIINVKNHWGVLDELEQGHTTLSQWMQVPDPDRIFEAAICRLWEVKK